ncbi:hypothetical protein PsorP6_010393 [Peronosclerospora sorghi]|uniref:Uncharacterized protein n=1 Tax=Peronosclerospora sorghi TaxID=230839 RepID=A0ACC0VX55_9STRA|nr:hypothetical protein PsorP6_010393 [Peronosclerospora sorghi]
MDAKKESKVYPDAATLTEYKLENDAVVYMCWKKENSDEWEELSVTHVQVADDTSNPSDAPVSTGS